MFVVFVKQLSCQFRRGQNVAPIIVNIFRGYDPVARGMLFSMFDAEIFACLLQSVTSIGKREGKCAQVEKMPSKYVVSFWFSGR